jgi:hypothetical protein
MSNGLRTYWVSWYPNGSFCYDGPWWEFKADVGNGKMELIAWAAVRAESELDAQERIESLHVPRHPLEWRFVDPKDGDWNPLDTGTHRFPAESWMKWPIEIDKHRIPNPAKEVASLVELALSPPLMGMGGGSATEERAIDRWKAKGAAETSRLRIAYGPPSKAPELHRFLDLASEIFGYSRSR